MKIIHIVPGSGDTFYCENCLRDGALIQELRKQGQDVLMVPMYLPLFLDNKNLSQDVPVFFGGINVYLQQQMALFRKTPRWLDRLFDSKWLLAQAAKKSGSTKADGLGSMTLSMLQGEDGKQAKELERLLVWLEEQEKPDLVHISNALLAGLANAIKRRLNVPVVCSLQDEDVWLDALDKPYDDLCWKAIAAQVDSVDAFIAVSDYFGKVMQGKIGIPQDKLHVIPAGIDFTGYQKTSLPEDPPMIGYMARMSESMGLGKLVDTFIELKKDERFSTARLKICGGETGDDKKYTSKLKQKLVRVGMLNDADFAVAFDRASRIEFLRGLTLLSVPTASGTAYGSYIIEAMGAGVPVVQPDAGAFRELIQTIKGGVLFDANRDGALLDSIVDLLANREKLKQISQAGREAATSSYSIDVTTKQLSSLYQSLI